MRYRIVPLALTVALLVVTLSGLKIGIDYYNSPKTFILSETKSGDPESYVPNDSSSPGFNENLEEQYFAGQSPLDIPTYSDSDQPKASFDFETITTKKVGNSFPILSSAPLKPQTTKLATTAKSTAITAPTTVNPTLTNPAKTTSPATTAKKQVVHQTTKAPTTTKTPPASDSGLTGYAAEVWRLVNAERSKAGLPPLSSNNSALNSAAQKRAVETEQLFSHQRPNGTKYFTVFEEFHVNNTASGENIACGQKTPADVMTGWMNSSGHRANILGNYTAVGIGVHTSSSGIIYWSQLFIR